MVENQQDASADRPWLASCLLFQTGAYGVFGRQVAAENGFGGPGAVGLHMASDQHLGDARVAPPDHVSVAVRRDGDPGPPIVPDVPDIPDEEESA